MDEASAALLGALVEHLATLLVARHRDAPQRRARAPRARRRLELGPLDARGRARARRGDALRGRAARRTRSRSRSSARRATRSSCSTCSLAPRAARASCPDTIEAAASARIDALDPGDRALIRRAAVLGLLFRAARLRARARARRGRAGRRGRGRGCPGTSISDGDGYLRFAQPDPRARSPTPACRSGCAARCTWRSARRSSATSAPTSTPTRRSSRCISAAPATTRARGATRCWAPSGRARASPPPTRRACTAGDRRRTAAPTIAGAELARVWEALGEALMLVGENDEAERALDAARRLIAGDPVAEARICFRRGQIAERNELARAVRWMRRGLRALERTPGAGGAALARAPDRRARVDPPAPAPLPRGRAALPRGARRGRGERRAARAGAGVPTRSTGRSSSSGASRRRPTRRARSRSTASSATPSRRGACSTTSAASRTGGVAGRRRSSSTEQAGACSERAGHAADVAFTDGNVGEILADQGRLEEAATPPAPRAARLDARPATARARPSRTCCSAASPCATGARRRVSRCCAAALADMERFGVDFYADARARADRRGRGARRRPAPRARRSPTSQLAAGNELRLAPDAACAESRLARLGDLDGAAAVARDRRCAAPASAARTSTSRSGSTRSRGSGVRRAAEHAERDAILARLGVVALPAISGLAASLELVGSGGA